MLGNSSCFHPIILLTFQNYHFQKLTFVVCWLPLQTVWHKQFAKVISKRQKLLLARRELNSYFYSYVVSVGEQVGWSLGLTLDNCIGIAPITQLRTCIIKIVTFKGGHLINVVKMIFHTILLGTALKRQNWLPQEQILSFKRGSHFEKGRNWRESLFDPVVSLWGA